MEKQEQSVLIWKRKEEPGYNRNMRTVIPNFLLCPDAKAGDRCQGR